MKKLTSLALFFLISLQGFASEDLNLKVLEKTMNLLEPRENAISLEQAKEMAAGESVDARIAYEKLFQAQQRIKYARSQYFPYGTGEIIALYFGSFWNPLVLAEVVLSIPSKWHNVRKEGHLRNAETHTLAALRENIKNQVAHLYFNILKEEAVVTLAEFEVKMLEELMRVIEVQVRAGVVDAQKLVKVEQDALRKRDAYLRFKALLAEEKTALKMLLNMSYDQDELVFQPVKKFLSHDAFTINPEMLAQTALNRSHEIKAAQEIIYAASRSRSSIKWSILSFTGLGFDYMQRVRFAGSYLNQAIMSKEALEINIENEVYSKEEALRNTIDFMLSEKSILENTKTHMLAQIENYKAQRISIDELINANMYYVDDFRHTIIAHYNSLARLDDLERVALGNVNSTDKAFPEAGIQLQSQRGGVTLSIDSEFTQIGNVQSVTYSFKNQSINDIKAFSMEGSFGVELQTGHFEYPLEGDALIIFENGEAVKKSFEFNQE